MFAILMTLLACGDKTTDSGEAEDTATTSDQEGTNDEGASAEEETSTDEASWADDGILETMEDYIAAYCSVYSMRCGGVLPLSAASQSSALAPWHARSEERDVRCGRPCTTKARDNRRQSGDQLCAGAPA